MKGFIEVKNVKTGKNVLIAVNAIVSVSPALQSGNAYGFIDTTKGCFVTEETYQQIVWLIEEAV